MPPSPPYVHIAAISLLTPLGDKPEFVLTAIKAGVSAYASSAYSNRAGKPMITTQVPEEAMAPLSSELVEAKLASRALRLLRLALPPLMQAMKSYAGAQPIPMFLAGPEILPNTAQPVSSNLMHYLLQDESLPISRAKCRYFASGRTGLLEAIDLAFQCFAQTNENYILVGAVDSYIDTATLVQLDREERIAAESICDSFVPGEGAGFILLCRPGLLESVTLSLHRPALALEPGHKYSNAPMLGQGLDVAFKQALSLAPDVGIGDIYSTMNGESWFAKEFGIAFMRSSSSFTAEVKHHHPIDALGDMGSATAVVLLAMAIDNLTRQKYGASLVYASADMGNRAAVVLSY